MLFAEQIIVPKNTTRDSPVIRQMFMASGIITWFSVLFPPGCAGLAHCSILHQNHQIVPSKAVSRPRVTATGATVDEFMDLSGDTFPIEWTDYYELYGVPYMLEIRCWNEDDTYSHQITVRIAILPRKAIIALAIVDAIKNLFSIGTIKRMFTARS